MRGGSSGQPSQSGVRTASWRRVMEEEGLLLLLLLPSQPSLGGSRTANWDEAAALPSPQTPGGSQANWFLRCRPSETRRAAEQQTPGGSPPASIHGTYQHGIATSHGCRHEIPLKGSGPVLRSYLAPTTRWRHRLCSGRHVVSTAHHSRRLIRVASVPGGPPGAAPHLPCWWNPRRRRGGMCR